MIEFRYNQKFAFRGVRGNEITSRMFVMPVINSINRSKPNPKPEWGTVPNLRDSS